MAATTKTPLGASTLVRKWYLDVNAGTHESPTWTAVNGITEFKAGVEHTLQDDADFDSGGYKSSTATAIAWSIEAKVARKVTVADPTEYDPGQELLREASDKLGASNTVEVRWYEMEDDGPREEAYQGYAAVSWSPDGGAMDALDIVSVTLTGQGKRSAIVHPDPAS